MTRLTSTAIINSLIFSIPLCTTSLQAQERPQKGSSSPVPTETGSQVQAPARTQPNPRNQGRVRVDATSAIQVNYGNPSWNRSPLSIETASLLMREGVTGRLVQISLQETAPDSSVFSGTYSITWEDAQKLQVEFYVPPQSLLGSEEGLKRVTSLIGTKQLRRHPFLLRRSAGGQQAIEIFDSRKQARAALSAYRAEQQAQAVVLSNRQNTPKKFPSDAEIEAAARAEELKARQAAAKLLAERVRLEQVEARRLRDLLAQFFLLTPAERAVRRRKAADLAAQGMTKYQEEDYDDAQALFDKAVELDPENRSYFYPFGVTLYRLDRNNRSIVYLQLANDPSVNAAERDYFIALNHYKMKDFAAALSAFDKVAATKDPELGPSAHFYKGLIGYERKHWETAQKSFQTVLDTSKDPRLDERAEAYIEQILRLRQFETERARKWQLSLTIGEMLDSNVLLSTDSSEIGLATDDFGYRTLLSGGVRYRPIYEESREFAAQLDLLTMYTLDKSLQDDQELRNTDPTMATLTLPWTYKGLAFGKGYKLDITPGYETIYMSIEDNETKAILNSYFVNFSNLFVMTNDWFSTYNLELRGDDSRLTPSDPADDASATKFKVANSNLIFVSSDKSRIITAEGAYTLNQAEGDNAKYNRIDFGVGYIQPWKWDTSANVRLAYFLLDYPDHSDGRMDNSVTLSAGLSRKIADAYSAGVLASYNINSSNVSANDYKKWTALLTFSALYGL